MDSTSTPCPRVTNPTSKGQAASMTGDLEASKTPAKTPTQTKERDIPQAIQRSQPSQVTATLKHPTQHSTLPQGQHDTMETRHSSALLQSTSALPNKQTATIRTPTTKDKQKKKKTKNKKKEGKEDPPTPLPPPPPLPAEVTDEDIYTFLDLHVPAATYAPIMAADIKVGFLNINALYGVTKMPYVHWLMRAAKLDVVALIDVRSTDASVPYLLANIRKELGPGSRVKSTYGPPGHEEKIRRRNRQSHNSRVGGRPNLCHEPILGPLLHNNMGRPLWSWACVRGGILSMRLSTNPHYLYILARPPHCSECWRRIAMEAMDPMGKSVRYTWLPSGMG